MYLSRLTSAPLLLAGLFLSACVTPTDTPTQTPVDAATDVSASPAPQAAPSQFPLVDSSFGAGSFGWDRDGKTYYRFKTLVANDEIFICGAFSGSGAPVARRLGRAAMKEGKVTIGDQVVIRNLLFFREASSAAISTKLEGQQSICKSTGLASDAVPSGSTVKVEIRSGRYRVRR